jgi:hypothetical protein
MSSDYWKKESAKPKQHTPPEGLFSLDGAGSMMTIHDCHQKSKAQMGAKIPKGTPPRKSGKKATNKEEAVDLTQDTEKDSAY